MNQAVIVVVGAPNLRMEQKVLGSFQPISQKCMGLCCFTISKYEKDIGDWNTCFHHRSMSQHLGYQQNRKSWPFQVLKIHTSSVSRHFDLHSGSIEDATRRVCGWRSAQCWVATVLSCRREPLDSLVSQRNLEDDD